MATHENGQETVIGNFTEQDVGELSARINTGGYAREWKVNCDRKYNTVKSVREVSILAYMYVSMSILAATHENGQETAIGNITRCRNV